MKRIKKLLAIVLTLAMVLTVAPTFNSPVKAGGDGITIHDISSGVSTIQNPDGTYDVKALNTVKFSLNSLNDKISDFKERYLNGKAAITVRIYSDTEYSKLIAEIVPECNSSKVIEFKVPAKYKGNIFYFAFDDPEVVNQQSELFKIVDGEIHVNEGPTFGSIYGTVSFLKKNFTIGINGYGVYRLNDDPKIYTTYTKIVKFYRNGSLVGTKKTTGNQVEFQNVPVSYGKNDTFKVALFMEIEGIEVAGPTTTFKSTSSKVPNIKLFATKIAKNKVYLRWQSVGGITGYYIYMGKKKIKTVGAKTTKKLVKKKKAAKGKFKVLPYVKVQKTIYKSTSNVAKPKKNQIKFRRDLNVKSRAHNYATCDFAVTKISLSGKTYKVTGYALNNRMFKVKKYRYLILGLKVDGKKAFYKKIKNIKLKIKAYHKKKFTFKIKGKAGKDLANGRLSLTVGPEPDWGFKNDTFAN